MIRIMPGIAIGEHEIEESFVRASGPGGQNVNKLASAVQLRFNVRASPALPDDVRARLARLAGSRLTRDGYLVIIAQRHRTQLRNRGDALERLIDLIRRAAVALRVRRPTSDAGPRGSAASKPRNIAPVSSKCAASGRRRTEPFSGVAASPSVRVPPPHKQCG